ncbi:MAG: enoyl-CoA hydratase/isomerase family protein, partial [Chloroflexota bacterium]|nr:enoyl-CoA hydratase/isomerase family protein [Chloroflexota bacterium]
PAAAVLLPRLVGRHRTMQLILTGKAISGVEAERIGLVNQAVPAGELDAAVEEIVGKLRSLSALSLRLARQAVLDTLDLPAEDGLRRLERFQIDELVPSYDAQEGLNAFIEKRPPEWRHR